MTDKTISNNKKVGDDYFSLAFDRSVKNNLKFYLDKFDINDYYIFKATAFVKQVTIEEFLEFDYARYVLFKKDKYDLEYILMWIDFMKNNFSYRFLDKPFSPFDPNKIKIIDRYE